MIDKKNKKTASLIHELRKIRDDMSLEMQGMTFEELKEYLRKRKPLHPTLYKRNAG